MSERQEKRKRFNQRLAFVAEFENWLANEPPMVAFWRWHRWKKLRPVWREVGTDE